MQDIPIGVVGFGEIAKVHAIACYAMQILYSEMPFRPVLQTVVRRNGCCPAGHVFSGAVVSLEEMLADSYIKLVDICTPNYLHFAQVKQALECGKNVYCEKPLGLCYQEAEQLADMAEAKGLINQVALVYRFLPAVVIAKEYIAKGCLGEIIHFNFALHHKGYLNVERPMSWRLKKAYSGGGAIMDLGIHMADLMRYLLGDVRQVQAYLATYCRQRPVAKNVIEKEAVDVDDYAKLEVELLTGGRGTIECSRISSVLHEGVEIKIYGSKGSITISSREPYYPTVHLHSDNVTFKGGYKEDSPFVQHINAIYPGEKNSLGLVIDMHLASLYCLFLRIAARKMEYAQAPTFREAAMAQKIIDMAILSESKNGSWIQWDELC